MTFTQVESGKYKEGWRVYSSMCYYLHMLDNDKITC